VNFFEIPHPDPPKAWRPSAPWRRPPDHELGVVLPLGIRIVQREDVVLDLVEIVGYSTGFIVSLEIVKREGELRSIFQTAMDVRLHESGVTDRFFRFGVEFSDGRRATNVENLAGGARHPTEPPAIYLDERNGGGSGHKHSTGAWIWPLPPGGTVTFVSEWPAIDLPTTRTELTANQIIEAATRSERLWNDDPEWQSTG
jgi:hypothetical protein